MRLTAIRARVIEALGGELPYDWNAPPAGPPDYYTDDGLPVYDLAKTIIMLDLDESQFTTMLMKLPDGHHDHVHVSWLEDEFVPRDVLWSDWGWVDGE